MKIIKLLVICGALAIALPADAASPKNPVNRKKTRKPAVVKPVAAPVAPVPKAEADPTSSWQAYSFP